MKAENVVVRASSPGDAPIGATGFELPPELASRYTVRIVLGANDEQRIGLFRATDRDNPSIEITDDRIVARNEDPETVAALVKIAQHSGWDRIAVDGSPEFRRAVWEAGTREGLVVSGYEPGFAEQARLETKRREDAARRDPATPKPTPVTAATAETVSRPVDQSVTAPNGASGHDADQHQLADSDRRLLLTLSGHIEDRRVLDLGMGPELDAFERDVQAERLDRNREGSGVALDRALDSHALVDAFATAGYDAATLREHRNADKWTDELADAVRAVRSQTQDADRSREAMSATLTSRAGEPMSAERSTTGSPADQVDHARSSGRRHESEELANLFLHGGTDRIAADPRLAPARQAQIVMEQHIGEVFGGDTDRIATASLESRQLISDALRRGLDVAAREPTPVRQIEPLHSRSDLER
ncbi:MAG: LPD7 domain-containing protein [Aestuariivirga sp.]|jgi:hypothetical protein|nr:LPD7 domain-containing protein [Sphingomonas melonis]